MQEMDWVRYDAPRISNCKFAITRREMSGGVGKLATGMKPDLPAGVEMLRGGGSLVVNVGWGRRSKEET